MSHERASDEHFAEREIARRHDAVEAEYDASDAIDAETLEAVRAMEAAEASLHRQLSRNEITQAEYEEQWTSLIESVPPDTHKASMDRRQSVKTTLEKEIPSTGDR